MPIGSQIYRPGPRFAAKRSYYRGIAHNIDGYVVIPLLGTYHWVYIADPNIVFTLILDPRFYPWSSNNWTLDHMITDWYLTIAPSPTAIPQPLAWSIFTRPDEPSNYLELRWNDVNFNHWIYTDFEEAPPDYWLPPPIDHP